MIPSNYIYSLNKIVRAVFEKSGKNLIFGHFGHFFSAIFREPKFSRTCGFLQKFRNDLFYRFKPFPDKTNAKFFFKVPKTSKNLKKPHFWPFSAIFWPKIFFFRKSGSVTFFYLLFPITMQKMMGHMIKIP